VPLPDASSTTYTRFRRMTQPDAPTSTPTSINQGQHQQRNWPMLSACGSVASLVALAIVLMDKSVHFRSSPCGPFWRAAKPDLQHAPLHSSHAVSNFGLQAPAFLRHHLLHGARQHARPVSETSQTESGYSVWTHGPPTASLRVSDATISHRKVASSAGGSVRDRLLERNLHTPPFILKLR